MVHGWGEMEKGEWEVMLRMGCGLPFIYPEQAYCGIYSSTAQWGEFL